MSLKLFPAALLRDIELLEIFIYRKCADRAKQQQISGSTRRGLHCKPAVPTLFSCPSVDKIETFSSAPSADAQCAPLRRQWIFFGQLRKNSAKFCNTDSLPLDVISTGCPGGQYAWRNLLGGEAWFPVRGISWLFAARIRLAPTARNDILR